MKGEITKVVVGQIWSFDNYKTFQLITKVVYEDNKLVKVVYQTYNKNNEQIGFDLTDNIYCDEFLKKFNQPNKYFIRYIKNKNELKKW